MQILRRSKSFLGDNILRGLAGSGSTHWYKWERMLFNRSISAVCIIVAIAICERVRIWCMRAGTDTVLSVAGGTPAGESFPFFENEMVGAGDKTCSSFSSAVTSLRGLPGLLRVSERQRRWVKLRRGHTVCHLVGRQVQKAISVVKRLRAKVGFNMRDIDDDFATGDA